jgi:O-antigen/teichoic acid export membrane protein
MVILPVSVKVDTATSLALMRQTAEPGRPPALDKDSGGSPRLGGLVANAGMMVAGRYVVAALGWLGTLLIVRTLSVAEFGQLSFVLSLVLLIAVFADLNIGRLSIKGLLDPERDPAAFAGTLVVLRAVMGAVTYAAVVLFVVVAGYPPEVVRAMLVAGVALLIATPSHAIEAVFQAHCRLGSVAVANVAGQLSQLALTAAVAVGGGSVVRFAIPAVLGEVVIVSWKLVRVRRIQSIRLNVDWATWRTLVAEAAPLAAGSIMATLYYRADSVMLSKLDTFTSVGIYNVAYKFVDLVHSVPAALMAGALALLVRSWPDDMNRFSETFRRAFTILVLVGVLVAVEFLIFASPLITLLYGRDYAEGANAAKVVVAAECIGAFGMLAFTVLLAMGRNRLYPMVAFIGLAVNVVLNLVLIPRASYFGAAVATLVTQVLITTLLMVPIARLEALRPFPIGRVGLALLGGGLSALAAMLARAVLPWPLAAATAAAVYALFVQLARVPGPQGWPALWVEASPKLRDDGPARRQA